MEVGGGPFIPRAKENYFTMTFAKWLYFQQVTPPYLKQWRAITMSMESSKSLQGGQLSRGSSALPVHRPLLTQGRGSSIPTPLFFFLLNHRIYLFKVQTSHATHSYNTSTIPILYISIFPGCIATFGRKKTINSGHPTSVGAFCFYFIF